jgi:hypothetical protein
MKRILGVAFSVAGAVYFMGVLLGPVAAVAQPSTDINTYVLFANNSLNFAGGERVGTGNIFGGNVGVNAVAGSSPTAVVGVNFNFHMSDNTSLVADRLQFGSFASAYDVYYNKTYGSRGGTIRNPPRHTFTAPLISSLPALGFTPGRSITDTATDYTIASGSPLTLTPGNYRDITVQQNGILNLSAGTYNIRNLLSDGQTQVNVTDGTILLIDGAFNLGNLSSFGAGTLGLAQVRVGSYNVSGTTINFGQSLEARGLFYGPNGSLKLGGDNNLFGRFWANTITSDKNDNIYFVVPEPSALVLVSLGLIACALRRRGQGV